MPGLCLLPIRVRTLLQVVAQPLLSLFPSPLPLHVAGLQREEYCSVSSLLPQVHLLLSHAAVDQTALSQSQQKSWETCTYVLILPVFPFSLCTMLTWHPVIHGFLLGQCGGHTGYGIRQT